MSLLLIYCLIYITLDSRHLFHVEQPFAMHFVIRDFVRPRNAHFDGADFPRAFIEHFVNMRYLWSHFVQMFYRRFTDHWTTVKRPLGFRAPAQVDIKYKYTFVLKRDRI